ncbi:potassium transporter Kup [Sphingomonas quercus]|uniref:Probable potassium transport system protein Kup n=1 Tax=Sphingomonas quercus TaxID=2842451 RepID=A0ABS6BNY4_9SPHN|nr:potassium transporter Kup [Sphingomonas quercus]MBU3078910.1 potassium transporter Kup [Sphingomonas quercus]
MSADASATPGIDQPAHGHELHGHSRQGTPALALGAIGVVFGDIGTSPLYSLKEAFDGHHPLFPDVLHVYGVLSLVFWTMTVIVTFKYVALIMRADNKGEGGSMALLALIQRASGAKRWSSSLVMLGVFATALFYGDSMVTPAISVLSAVEGLTTVQAGLEPFVVPIAVVLLIALFLLQARGTEWVGKLFGPVMLAYFLTLAVLGAINIAYRPEVLTALNPMWAVRFFAADGMLAFLALGAVILSVTGAEALYADMGHFGRRPITLAWLYLVFPSLILNYLGQTALLANHPEAAQSSPFFLLASDEWRLPLVILATLATVIASQSVITGAFSVTQQAIQLGFMPRLRIAHTSASRIGQIYIPALNWGLMIMVLGLVLGFRNSTNLAAAYGIAVTGTMFITSCMLGVLLYRVWNKPLWMAVPVALLFLVVDGAYFSSNLTKVVDGGWFPLLVGLITFTMLTTWAKGRRLMLDRLREAAIPVKVFVQSAVNSAVRVPGTAVFMTTASDGVPHALLHNLKHNKVLHERVILLTVRIEDVPYVERSKRVDFTDLGEGFYRVVLRYGFIEDPDVPAALALVTQCGPQFRMMDTSFFLARQTLLASSRPGMALWRERLFGWMMRNAESAMEFFRLPTNRVVELGSQVEI